MYSRPQLTNRTKEIVDLYECTCLCLYVLWCQEASSSLLVWHPCPTNHRVDWPPQRSTVAYTALPHSLSSHPEQQWLQTCNEIAVTMALQIRSVPSCSVASLSELWIIHPDISPHCLYFFFFLFVDMDVNNQKCLKALGLRRLRCIFDGPGDSVRHGWYIFEWHFISAISLILMRFLSFIGVCARISVCARVRVAAIKWKKSLYQTICFWQWRLTAQRRRDLCWPWTADWTKEAYDTRKIVSLIPPSGRSLRKVKNKALETIVRP